MRLLLLASAVRRCSGWGWPRDSQVSLVTPTGRNSVIVGTKPWRAITAARIEFLESPSALGGTVLAEL
jgi:hypothetical protein